MHFACKYLIWFFSFLALILIAVTTDTWASGDAT